MVWPDPFGTTGLFPSIALIKMRAIGIIFIGCALIGCAPRPVSDPPAFDGSPALSTLPGFLQGSWQEDDDPDHLRKTNVIFNRFHQSHSPVLTFKTGGSFALRVRYCTVHGTWESVGNGARLAASDVDGYKPSEVERRCSQWRKVPTVGVVAETYPYDVTVEHFQNSWLEREAALETAKAVAQLRLDSDQKRLVSTASDNPYGSVAEVVWVRTR